MGRKKKSSFGNGNGTLPILTISPERELKKEEADAEAAQTNHLVAVNVEDEKE